MNNLDLLRHTLVFATVAELGSFRAAADRLGLSPPYVSQLVSDLERRLGRQLLFRSTRKLALTEDGEAFLPHAITLAEAFHDGLDSIGQRRRRLSGRLRISAPTVLANPVFARLIARFSEVHPALRLDIDLNDRAVDPVEARVDLAIRIGDPGDDARLARKLFETRGVICCAPQTATRIEEPTDLDTLSWLSSPMSADRIRLIGPNGTTMDIAPKRRIIMNSAALIRTTLIEGGGFALFPEFAVREALATGLLINPISQWSTGPVPVYALFSERRTELGVARIFVDAVLRALKDEKT